MGHNPLDQFLTRISDTCGLSDYYTNHCIRMTGITNFKKGNRTDSQIMAASGHKSIQSLTLYQRVSDDEKLMMGMKLTFSLLQPQEAEMLKDINTHCADLGGACLARAPPLRAQILSF